MSDSESESEHLEMTPNMYQDKDIFTYSWTSGKQQVTWQGVFIAGHTSEGDRSDSCKIIFKDDGYASVPMPMEDRCPHEKGQGRGKTSPIQNHTDATLMVKSSDGDGYKPWPVLAWQGHLPCKQKLVQVQVEGTGQQQWKDMQGTLSYRCSACQQTGQTGKRPVLLVPTTWFYFLTIVRSDCPHLFIKHLIKEKSESWAEFSQEIERKSLGLPGPRWRRARPSIEIAVKLQNRVTTTFELALDPESDSDPESDVGLDSQSGSSLSRSMSPSSNHDGDGADDADGADSAEDADSHGHGYGADGADGADGTSYGLPLGSPLMDDPGSLFGEGYQVRSGQVRSGQADKRPSKTNRRFARQTQLRRRAEASGRQVHNKRPSNGPINHRNRQKKARH